MRIGKIELNKNRTRFLAEAGVNHNNSLENAEILIKTASRAGADIIKFQTYKAEKLVTKKAERFWDWDGEEIKNGSQYDSYSQLDKFNEPEYKKMKQMCDKNNIEFMSTPFDIDSVHMLKNLGVNAYKIASCDLTNFQLLKEVSTTQLPILLSTGASNIEEIGKTLDFLDKCGTTKDKICIMHCTLCYPTKPEDANLDAILDIKKNFPDYLLGLSDHTLGIDVALAASMYELAIIEKHYTYDKSLKLSADHWLSINEEEVAELVNKLKIYNQSRGHGIKEVLQCEGNTHKLARRSVVTKVNIKSGRIIEENDIIAKRPGTGIPASEFFNIVGRKAIRDIEEDEIIKYEDIE